ncbi:hypothetical protein CCAX7_22830 [Capsulimonas corticalis]|uniref:Uncharacterized protein n=1 Tax=Capsulimonas corticalis TaxID=2219043 RepID=A0A402CV02_9BACT|nr:hypothetical protein [Capsulimonas corticalis]BDI30232.1 hypothetical protein CCAX7_22830 [Capsulimonas corticalis]
MINELSKKLHFPLLMLVALWMLLHSCFDAPMKQNFPWLYTVLGDIVYLKIANDAYRARQSKRPTFRSKTSASASILAGMLVFAAMLYVQIHPHGAKYDARHTLMENFVVLGSVSLVLIWWGVSDLLFALGRRGRVQVVEVIRE